MEEFPLKIIGVDFDKDCPRELIEPSKKYFQLNDDLQFEFTINQLKEEFNLKDKDFKSIRQFSKLVYEVYCNKCKTHKIQFTAGKQDFLNLFSYLRYKSHYSCEDCEDAKRNIKLKQFKKQEEEKYVKKVNNLFIAIEQKAWRKLPPFHFKVLKKCLTLDSFKELKKAFGINELVNPDDVKLYLALRELSNMNLIRIETKFDSRWYRHVISDYKCSNELKRAFEYNFNVEDNRNIIASNNSKSNVANSIKMRLTINDYQNHSDSPLYAGTVKFMKKIVIEPAVRYAFAQWKRSNDDLFFTLVPTSEIAKLPVQKTLSQEPKAVREHITNYLDNLKIE